VYELGLELIHRLAQELNVLEGHGICRRNLPKQADDALDGRKCDYSLAYLLLWM
jgi:hypothetical protein